MRSYVVVMTMTGTGVCVHDMLSCRSASLATCHAAVAYMIHAVSALGSNSKVARRQHMTNIDQ